MRQKEEKEKQDEQEEHDAALHQELEELQSRRWRRTR